MKDISASEYIRTNFHPSDRLPSWSATAVRAKRSSVSRLLNGSREFPLRNGSSTRMKKRHATSTSNEHPETRGTPRTKEDIQTIRHLYLDIDHDGPPALAKIRQSNLVPPPNYT